MPRGLGKLNQQLTPKYSHHSTGEACIAGTETHPRTCACCVQTGKGCCRLSGRELCDALFVLAAARRFKGHPEVAEEAWVLRLLRPSALQQSRITSKAPGGQDPMLASRALSARAAFVAPDASAGKRAVAKTSAQNKCSKSRQHRPLVAS